MFTRQVLPVKHEVCSQCNLHVKNADHTEYQNIVHFGVCSSGCSLSKYGTDNEYTNSQDNGEDYE